MNQKVLKILLLKWFDPTVGKNIWWYFLCCYFHPYTIFYFGAIEAEELISTQKMLISLPFTAVPLYQIASESATWGCVVLYLQLYLWCLSQIHQNKQTLLRARSVDWKSLCNFSLGHLSGGRCNFLLKSCNPAWSVILTVKFNVSEILYLQVFIFIQHLPVPGRLICSVSSNLIILITFC